MQDGNLELIITLVPIIGTVLAAFGLLHREMRRGFERVDRRFEQVDRRFEQVEAKFDNKIERLEEKFDNKIERLEEKFDNKFERLEEKFDKRFEQMDEKVDGLRADVGTLQVSVARIEGHLGLVAPAPTAPRAGSEPPERVA